MSSGERPIGAAKGKQSDTEALCQPPPPRVAKVLTDEEQAGFLYVVSFCVARKHRLVKARRPRVTVVFSDLGRAWSWGGKGSQFFILR